MMGNAMISSMKDKTPISSSKTNKETLNKAILLFVLIAILAAILYLSNNTNIFRGVESEKTEIEKSATSGDKLLDCAKKIALNEDLLKDGGSIEDCEEEQKNDKVLDCAKKIALNEDLLKDGEDEDCLFMGCGDFFR